MTFNEALIQYAAPVVVLAVISMAAVGLIKIFTKMIPDENSVISKIMSYLYLILSAVSSIATVVCYYHFYLNVELDWAKVLELSATVYACTQVLYPIYRDYGGRYLLLKVLSIFKGRNAKTDEIIASIEKIMVLSEDQKAKLKATIKEDID